MGKPRKPALVKRHATINGETFYLEARHSRFLHEIAAVLTDPLTVNVAAMIEGGAAISMRPNGAAVTYRHSIPIRGRAGSRLGKPTIKALRRLRCVYCEKHLCDCVCL